MAKDTIHIAIIGLGYVGLPLAVSLSENYSVIGYDENPLRIAQLKNGIDRTNECSRSTLEQKKITFSSEISALSQSNMYIITVPTPVDKSNKPDLSAIKLASKSIAQLLKKNDIVVFESTVYPGVTEEIGGAILEKGSGLTCGKDFFLGYSPERINPGDRMHSVKKIPKVVAGQTKKVTKTLSEVYGSMNRSGRYKASKARQGKVS